MCTILMLHRVHPEFPLVIAANRDEFYARPAGPPRLLEPSPERIAGGIDLERGGTWLGATERGLFVALTNQRVYGPPPDTGLRSRGEIVLDALRQGTVAGVERYLAGLDVRAYNSFNLLFGDGDALHVAYARRAEGTLRVEPVPPGVHTLPNDSIGSESFPKTRRAEGLVHPHTRDPWPVLQPALARTLGDHQLPPLGAIPAPPPDSLTPHELLQQLQALDVHTPVYGTRSASILALSPGRVHHYLFADGHPCVTPFESYTHLLA